MPRRTPSSPPVPEIIASLRRIAAHLSGGSSDDWMGLTVTMPQWKVLLLLRENGKMRVGVVASHLQVSTPTITGIVDRLVRQELVEREDDPTDRRVVLNVLTPKGEGLLEQVQHGSDAEMRRLVGTLSAQEQTEVGEALKRLDDALTAGS
jgi:DNA-binding MarR family transcriptional regulator